MRPRTQAAIFTDRERSSRSRAQVPVASPAQAGLAGAFKAAGFPTRISGDMDAWLKAHAFFVTAVSGDLMAGGDCRRLSEDSVALTLMTKGCGRASAPCARLA
jgi:hypothetical protein